jgi:hypothetical protein
MNHTDWSPDLNAPPPVRVCEVYRERGILEPSQERSQERIRVPNIERESITAPSTLHELPPREAFGGIEVGFGSGYHEGGCGGVEFGYVSHETSPPGSPQHY